MSLILALDPGPTHTGYLSLCDGKPQTFGKVTNGEMLNMLLMLKPGDQEVVIERIASYGMPVGREVFDTVWWSGRFAQAVFGRIRQIERLKVKTYLCHSAKAKDSNIRQALIDRFGGETAIGRKASPGPLYGISGDVWAALALAVYAQDNP